MRVPVAAEENRTLPRPIGVAPGRLIVAAVIGLAAALVAATMAMRPLVTLDLLYYWNGARLWLHGVNPYTVPLHSSLWTRPDPLFYPLPTLVLTAPVAWLPLPVAAGIFTGLPLGLLAWIRTRDGALWELVSLAHPGVVMAVVLGQWSPWLMLAMMWPALGCFFLAKPTLGAACWLHRPTWQATIGAVLLLALSLVLMPAWPALWLRNLSQVAGHPIPLLTALGSVTLLTLARWRDRDTWLVLAMSCVPQLLFFADQAPLVMIARTKREALWLVGTGWLAWLLWHHRHYHTDAFVAAAVPYVLVGCYWPVVALVLYRAIAIRGKAARPEHYDDGAKPAAQRREHAHAERGVWRHV